MDELIQYLEEAATSFGNLRRFNCVVMMGREIPAESTALATWTVIAPPMAAAMEGRREEANIKTGNTRR